jgi:hypothetical protein
VFKRATFLLAGAVLFASAVSPVQAQTDATLLLMQRLAGGYGGAQTDVTVGSLPKGWTSPVPLPDVPVLGTVRAGTQQTMTLYFNPGNAQTAAEAYINQLRAAGFTTAPSFPGLQAGGFAASAQPVRNSYFCRGTQLVSIVVPPGAATDLRVMIQPSSGAFDMCGRLPEMLSASAIAKYSSPLPQFSAPSGSEMAGAGTNFRAAGTTSSLGSSATITGNQTAAVLLNSFASQLQHAGWQVTGKAASRDTAIMSFHLSKPPARWHGTLSLARIATSNSFDARVDVSGEGSSPPQSVFGSIRIPQISSHAIKPSDPAIVQLLKRLALNSAGGYRGAGSAEVYVGKTPPGIGNIPMPNVKPVGSTLVRQMGVTGSPSAYTVYYDLSNAQLQSYLRRLKSNGWTSQAFPTGAMGGFGESAFSGMALLCKTGAGILSIMAAPPAPNQVTIFGTTQSGPSCPIAEGLQTQTDLAQRSPLPQFTAPEGVVMQPGTPGITGSPSTSGASLVTNIPLPALLDAFSAQLTKNGWTEAPSSATDALGSRSFTLTDSSGQHWQAVMTIYRSAIQPDHYYSYIDLTNLTVEATRRLR